VRHLADLRPFRIGLNGSSKNLVDEFGKLAILHQWANWIVSVRRRHRAEPPAKEVLHGRGRLMVGHRGRREDEAKIGSLRRALIPGCYWRKCSRRCAADQAKLSKSSCSVVRSQLPWAIA
jgi:hypothetical protein